MSEIFRLDNFGGVNLTDHPRDLADNEFAWAENIYPLSPSTLALRKGSSFAGGVSPADDYVQQALVGYNHSNGQRYIYGLFLFGSAPNRITRLYLLDENETSWGTALFSGILSSNEAYNPAWAIWRDRLYLLRSDGFLAEIEGGTVISTTELSVTVDGGGLTIHPTLIGQYRNRMLYAGDPTYPNFLFFSNTDAPLTITADAVIRVGRGDGGRIAAIASAGTTGGDAPAESQILILKEKGPPWLFRGDLPTAGANAGQADLHQLSVEADCINHRTVALTPQGLMWAGHKDVFLMRSKGALPESVGYKIGPALKTVPPALRHRMRAVYYDDFYRLMLERGPTLATATQQVWADVRTPKITWWGPMTGGNWSDFYADHRPGYSSRLLASTAREAVSTWYSGRLYALDMSNHSEAPLDSDILAPTPIRPVLRTKEYDFGDANQRKIIEAAELNFWNDRNRSVTVTFLGDTNRVVEVAYSAGGWTLGNTLPSGALASLHRQINFSAQSVARTVSRTLQLQIEATSLGNDTDVGAFYIQELVMRMRRIQRRVA